MKERSSNFEILRVVSMLLVVLAHYISWGTTHNGVGNICVSFSDGGINAILFPFFSSLTALGVICYILITGYFLCDSEVVRFDRLFKVWSQTLFYSVLLAFGCSYFLKLPASKLILSFFPIGTDQYWFVSKYVVLVLLAPFFSTVIHSLNQKSTIILLLILFSITITISHGFPYGNVFFPDSPFSVSSFVLLFFIAAYIKKYGIPEKFAKHSMAIFLGSILIQGAIGIVSNIMHPGSPTIIGGFSVGYNAFSIIPGTALFIWFSRKSFSDNPWTKFLVKLAPYTFATYLIHDNCYFREILWNRIINPADYWQSSTWSLFAILIPICILLICCAIDSFRSIIFRAIGMNNLNGKIARFNFPIERNNDASIKSA